MDYDISLIRQTLFFKGLSDFQIKLIFDGCVSFETIASGATIIAEESASDDLCFIAKGRVRVEMSLGLPEPRHISTIEGPVVLGEISYLDKSPRSATIKADEDLGVYVISGHDLDALLGEMPATGHKIKHNIALSVARTLRGMNSILSDEMKKSRFLQHKAAELGANKYNEAISNLARRIHFSA